MTLSPEVLDLIGLQKAEFARATMLRSRVLKLQAAIAVTAIVTIPQLPELWLYGAAIVALVLAVLAFFFWKDMGSARAHAERLRRTTMLICGLGVEIARAELLELKQDASCDAAEAARLRDPNYFRSQQPIGLVRFVEMLEESAIWTSNLAKYASREAWIFFLCVALILFVVLFASSAMVSSSQWQIVARIVMAILATLLSADYLGSALAYAGTRNATLRIIDKLQQQKVTPSEGHIMLLFADYNSTVESMPPFPSGLYSRHRKRLNDDYDMILTGPQ